LKAHPASYGEGLFGIVRGSGFFCLLAIELERLPEGNLETLDKFFPAFFLAIDAGHFLNPSDPPVTILLGYRSIRIGHLISSRRIYLAAVYRYMLLLDILNPELAPIKKMTWIGENEG
jgi:hypothetical protein